MIQQRIKFILVLTLLLLTTEAMPFCGFYVAKADAEMYNKSSQVIFVRDGNRSVITMSNDYQGKLKDFAMVVPVPEVLKRKNIRIVDGGIFKKLDAYSAPRIVEYHDNDPCQRRNVLYDKSVVRESESAPMQGMSKKEKDLGVSIEANYEVGEYDILILSAEESSGLKTWLKDHDYKIPQKAEEVLEPYIKNDLKFFVVKVDLERQKKQGFDELRPLQIAFSSDRFMLPIRLGMANSNGEQDMLVYTFTRNGRVETANYRTVKIPTDKNVPVFVQNEFGPFYKDLFEHTRRKEGESSVFLEYSWDLSSSNFVKCDPCASTPPAYEDLREAGVFWVKKNGRRRGANYSGELHFTRMHVRYDRESFSQDLFFQTTPNDQRFQGRYVIHHPVSRDLQCDQANDYYKNVVDRRKRELQNLASLTGWDVSEHQDYVEEFASKIQNGPSNGWIDEDSFEENGFPGIGSGLFGGGNGPSLLERALFYSLAGSALLVLFLFLFRRYLLSVFIRNEG